jgi:hypothetical protein
MKIPLVFLIFGDALTHPVEVSPKSLCIIVSRSP